MKRKGWASGILGLLAFIFSYFFSLVNNTWQTSLFRASIGFLLFLVLGFFIITVLQQVLLKRTAVRLAAAEPSQEEQIENKVEPKEEDDFQSISLQTLHDGGQAKPSDEDIAQATRSWLKENGGDSR